MDSFSKVVKIQRANRKGDSAGRIAYRATWERLVTGSKETTRTVGRVFNDVITTTDTGVVCDSPSQGNDSVRELTSLMSPTHKKRM